MKVKNIASNKKLCADLACPCIFETDRDSFIVVGTIPATTDLPRNVLKKLGKGEMAVEVPKNILEK